MKSTSIRRAIAPGLTGVAALALAAALTGCGAGNESGSGSSDGLSGTLNGAGSSAQEAAQGAWTNAFQTKNGDATVNYDPSGSGAGVEKFNANGVDFAGSDAALDEGAGEIAAAKKRCGADAIEVPNFVSPIAVAYNLKGVDKLNLSADTVAKIFDGKITTWNDAAIKAENSGVTLPSTKITPVHRSDESGTTKNFTDYLSKAAKSSWTHPADKVWPTKSGEAANGTSGLVAAVGKGDGAIGYADLGQIGTLKAANIKVGSDYVTPSAEGAAKALEVSPVAEGRPENDMAIDVDRTTTEAGAYPLMLTSYLIACPTYSDAKKADLVKGYLSYIVSDEGQKAGAEKAGAAPLPAKLAQQAQDIVAKIAKG